MTSCANQLHLTTIPKFSQKHFIIDNNGHKSSIYVRSKDGEYHFVWLNPMNAPIARKFLKYKQCGELVCAKFENDGFLPPTKSTEVLFLELLEHIEQNEFEITVNNRIYKVINANLFK